MLKLKHLRLPFEMSLLQRLAKVVGEMKLPKEKVTPVSLKIEQKPMGLPILTV